MTLAMALRQAISLLVLGTCAALHLPAAWAGESGWRPAVDRLAHEKTLAEGCVSVLETCAVRDPIQRVQAQRIYARARADVEGLVALLEADLAGDRSPAAIPELVHRLHSVPRQRQALCRSVEAAVAGDLGASCEGVRAAELLADDIAGDAMPLSDAAVQIWKAYRRAGEPERKRIIAAIEGTRWRDYAEVSPGE
jgi:hypothetical protein